MAALKVLALLISLSVLVTEATLLSAPTDQQAFIYRAQIKVVSDLLLAECPDQYRTRSARAVIAQLVDTDVEVQKVVYQRLLRRLIECRERSSTSPGPTTTGKHYYC